MKENKRLSAWQVIFKRSKANGYEYCESGWDQPIEWPEGWFSKRLAQVRQAMKDEGATRE